MQAIKVILTTVFVLATVSLGQASDRGRRVRDEARPPNRGAPQVTPWPGVARDVTTTGSISVVPQHATPAPGGAPLSRPFSKGPPSFK